MCSTMMATLDICEYILLLDYYLLDTTTVEMKAKGGKEGRKAEEGKGVEEEGNKN